MVAEVLTRIISAERNCGFDERTPTKLLKSRLLSKQENRAPSELQRTSKRENQAIEANYYSIHERFMNSQNNNSKLSDDARQITQIRNKRPEGKSVQRNSMRRLEEGNNQFT